MQINWGAYRSLGGSAPWIWATGCAVSIRSPFPRRSIKLTLDNNPGGLFVNFIAGGIDGSQATPQLPYSDVSCTGGPETCMPFKASQGVNLNTAWQSISIDLLEYPADRGDRRVRVGIELSPDRRAGAPPQTIFIDDIVWGVKW